jgi:hypothetical protein
MTPIPDKLTPIPEKPRIRRMSAHPPEWMCQGRADRVEPTSEIRGIGHSPTEAFFLWKSFVDEHRLHKGAP